MLPQDMVKVLTLHGFTELKLVKTEGKGATFSYTKFSEPKLRKNFGAPTVTANKKVMVFAIPDVGRLGISPSNSMVRFIPDHEVARPETQTTHLGKVEIPKPYLVALEKAKVSKTVRTAWATKMWEWFNENKFGGRMTAPRFIFGPSFPGHPTARGVYVSGPNHGPGKLFLADYMFNARPAFIIEVFLHEMCHQAVWTLDRYRDPNDKTQGHGTNWQAWMKKVGLDPRRFDPTEDTEYMSTQDARAAEARLTRQYGPRAPESYWKNKRKAPVGYTGDAVLRYRDRALDGHMEPKQHGKYPFRYQNVNGHSGGLSYTAWPDLYLKD